MYFVSVVLTFSYFLIINSNQKKQEDELENLKGLLDRYFWF